MPCKYNDYCLGCGKKEKEVGELLWAGTTDKDGNEESICGKCEKSGKYYINC